MGMQEVLQAAPSMEGQLRMCIGRLEHARDFEGMKQEVINVSNILINLLEQIQRK